MFKIEKTINFFEKKDMRDCITKEFDFEIKNYSKYVI